MDINDKKDEIKSILFLFEQKEDSAFIKGVEFESLLRNKRDGMIALISKSKSLYIARALKPYITKVDQILNEIK